MSSNQDTIIAAIVDHVNKGVQNYIAAIGPEVAPQVVSSPDSRDQCGCTAVFKVYGQEPLRGINTFSRFIEHALDPLEDMQISIMQKTRKEDPDLEILVTRREARAQQQQVSYQDVKALSAPRKRSCCGLCGLCGCCCGICRSISHCLRRVCGECCFWSTIVLVILLAGIAIWTRATEQWTYGDGDAHEL